MEIIKPTINQIADMTLEIMGLIRAYVEECKLPLDVNPDHIFAMLFEAAQNQDMYLIFAVDKGELVGYFLCTLGHPDGIICPGGTGVTCECMGTCRVEPAIHHPVHPAEQ